MNTAFLDASNLLEILGTAGAVKDAKGTIGSVPKSGCCGAEEKQGEANTGFWGGLRRILSSDLSEASKQKLMVLVLSDADSGNPVQSVLSEDIEQLLMSEDTLIEDYVNQWLAQQGEPAPINSLSPELRAILLNRNASMHSDVQTPEKIGGKNEVDLPVATPTGPDVHGAVNPESRRFNFSSEAKNSANFSGKVSPDEKFTGDLSAAESPDGKITGDLSAAQSPDGKTAGDLSGKNSPDGKVSLAGKPVADPATPVVPDHVPANRASRPDPVLGTPDRHGSESRSKSEINNHKQDEVNIRNLPEKQENFELKNDRNSDAKSIKDLASAVGDTKPPIDIKSAAKTVLDVNTKMAGEAAVSPKETLDQQKDSPVRSNDIAGSAKPSIIPGQTVAEQFSGSAGESGEESRPSLPTQEGARLNSVSSSAKANDASSLPEKFQSDVINQIVEKAALLRNRNQPEMQIKLKPDFLGNIRLTISTDQQQVMVRVFTDVPMVKDMLVQNLAQLQMELQQHGLEVDKFDVRVGQDPPQGSPDRHAGQHRSPGNPQANSKDAETASHDSNKKKNRDKSGGKKGNIDYFA
ncbi:MAG: hypothetical protein HKM93_07540 [Desulfobacteraceae bacterium]|nr:hypothetical protein [Desulfobacteraceae bacterium]